MFFLVLVSLCWIHPPVHLIALSYDKVAFYKPSKTSLRLYILLVATYLQCSVAHLTLVELKTDKPGVVSSNLMTCDFFFFFFLNIGRSTNQEKGLATSSKFTELGFCNSLTII